MCVVGTGMSVGLSVDVMYVCVAMVVCGEYRYECRCGVGVRCVCGYGCVCGGYRYECGVWVLV